MCIFPYGVSVSMSACLCGKRYLQSVRPSRSDESRAIASRSLLPLLGLLLLLCGAVESHGDLSVGPDELTSTVKGGLTLAATIVAILLVILFTILTTCCWYNCCKVVELQRKTLKDVEGEGVELTKVERGGDREGSGEDGGPKVATVQLEDEGKDKEDKATEKESEGKQKDGAEAFQPPESQGSAGLHPIPVPPPIVLDLSPAILKQKPSTSEAAGATTDVKATKEKSAKESSGPSIMQELLSRAILKPKLASSEASAADDKSAKETPITENSETKASSEKADSLEEKKLEAVASPEEVKPKPAEDTEKKPETVIMNFDDIDSALGQALKGLGDF